MKGFYFCCCAYFFFVFVAVAVEASLSTRNLPPNPTFEQYALSLVKMFIDKDAARDRYPYYLVQLVLHLDKYGFAEASGEKIVNSTFSRSFHIPETEVTAKLIIHELRGAFEVMNTDHRFSHISGLEMIFDGALTAAIENYNGNVRPILQFLDEALAKEHPLSLFPAMKMFSENEYLLAFEAATLTYGPVFSVCDAYTEFVQSNVKEILSSISSSYKSHSKAGTIDFLILIHHHFRGMIHGFDLNDKDQQYLRILNIVTRFTDEAFSTFYEFIQDERNFHSVKAFYEALCDRVRATKPYEFARLKCSLDYQYCHFNNDILSFIKIFFSEAVPHLSSYFMTQANYDQAKPSILDELWSKLEAPKGLNEHRAHMVVFFMLAECDPKFQSNGSFCFEGLPLTFTYSLVKRIDELFPGTASELFTYEVEDVLAALEYSLKKPLSFHQKVNILFDSMSLGAYETIAFLTDSGVEISEVETYNYLVDHALKSRNQKMIDFAMHSYSTFEGQFYEAWKIGIFKSVISKASLEVVSTVVEYLPESCRTGDSFLYFASSAIEDRSFLNFDFLCKRFGGLKGVLSRELRLKLFQFAMESRLPEAKVRNYLERFGKGIVLRDNIEANEKLLFAAAANGYLSLIQDFSLYKVDEYSKAEAVSKAGWSGHTEIIQYLINIFEVKSNLERMASIAKKLIQCKNREMLAYVIEQAFGTNYSPDLKAQILAVLVVNYENEFYKGFAKDPFVEFCSMMGWNRSQIDYTGKTRHAVKNLLSPSQTYSRGYWSLNEIMREYLDLLPRC